MGSLWLKPSLCCYSGGGREAACFPGCRGCLQLNRCAPPPTSPDPPSPGAAHYGLDPSYQAFLNAQDSYATAGASTNLLFGPTAGALASAAVLLTSAAPALPLVAAAQLFGGSSSSSGSSRTAADGGGGQQPQMDPQPSSSQLTAATAQLGALAMQATWAVHDTLLENVFGSGCSNPKR